MTLWKLGCRWGSNTPLFYDFIKNRRIVIGWIDKDYQIGDWLLIANGFKILALAKVTSKRECVLNNPDLESDLNELQIPFEKNIFTYKAQYIFLSDEDYFDYQLQQGICRVQSSDVQKKFKTLLQKYRSKEMLKSMINILKFKKQIILQGAPGTGKTYNAKLIAEELVKDQIILKDKPNIITNSDILNILTVGLQIQSVSNYTQYKIEKIENNKIELSGNKIEPKTISFHKIISSYENKQWEPNKIINNLDSYEAALAFYIYNNIGDVVGYRDKEKYIKLVQFHPSYSYEDFVRGIVMNANNGFPEYISQNKILGGFATEAYNNWIDSQKTEEEISKEEWLTEQFEKFVDFINEEMISNLGDNYQLTDKVNIIAIENDAFRYTGSNWKNGAHRMLFKDIKQAYLNGNKTRQDIKKNSSLSGLARQDASYYIRVLDNFREYLRAKKITNIPSSKNKVKLNKYVLIIDEINRANLPAVLGELIYALEYRDEKVESMYAVDGDNGLILPPNLYIIGTMNTADRSVGQIDYAIRRRFAFVDMLPTILGEDSFDSDLFKEVSKLFIQNIEEYITDNSVSLVPSDHLSSEFRPEDVWIGHSYFIMKDSSRNMRLRYEIIPILKEYLRDGILRESAKEVIENFQ